MAARVRAFTKARIVYYPNSSATDSLRLLMLSGDVEVNHGDETGRAEQTIPKTSLLVTASKLVIEVRAHIDMIWRVQKQLSANDVEGKGSYTGARSGQNSVYYFCPLWNYFYGVQHLFSSVLQLFL